MKIRIVTGGIFLAYLASAAASCYPAIAYYHCSVIGLLLFGLLPVIAAGLLAFTICCRFRTGKARTWGLIGLVLFIGCSLELLRLINGFGSTLATITNPRIYALTMQRHWQGDPLVAHFPQSIPADAREVHFYAMPHLMQGGPSTQLRYITTPQQADALFRLFSHQKIAWRHPTDDDSSAPAMIIDETGRSVDLPADFAYLLLPDTPAAKKYGSGYAQSHGIAISRSRYEVVYWAWEAW